MVKRAIRQQPPRIGDNDGTGHDLFCARCRLEVPRLINSRSAGAVGGAAFTYYAGTVLFNLFRLFILMGALGPYLAVTPTNLDEPLLHEWCLVGCYGLAVLIFLVLHHFWTRQGPHA